MKAKDVLSPERQKRFEIETANRQREISWLQGQHNKLNPNRLMSRAEAAQRVAGQSFTRGGGR